MPGSFQVFDEAVKLLVLVHMEVPVFR
jgi:hypothetical protein